MYTIKKQYQLEDNNTEDKSHYVYLCEKQKDANDVCKENFDNVINELKKNELLEERFFEDCSEKEEVEEKNENNDKTDLFDLLDYKENKEINEGLLESNL